MRKLERATYFEDPHVRRCHERQLLEACGSFVCNLIVLDQAGRLRGTFALTFRDVGGAWTQGWGRELSFDMLSSGTWCVHLVLMMLMRAWNSQV